MAKENPKLDLRKAHKALYQIPSGKIVDVDVPALRYLMIDGKGDPNQAPAFAEAMEALFSVSYTAKFKVKKGRQAIDYAVMPPEGLWWAEDMGAFLAGDKSNWLWTLMIAQPDCADDALLRESIDEVRIKKKLPGVDRLRMETLHEGLCAQVLHIGPFSEEGPVIARLHAHIESTGARLHGKHHEIYLSDTRRTAPEKWKTIIRQGFMHASTKGSLL